jgi:hypothetical protein
MPCLTSIARKEGEHITAVDFRRIHKDYVLDGKMAMDKKSTKIMLSNMFDKEKTKTGFEKNILLAVKMACEENSRSADQWLKSLGLEAWATRSRTKYLEDPGERKEEVVLPPAVVQHHRHNPPAEPDQHTAD